MGMTKRCPMIFRVPHVSCSLQYGVSINFCGALKYKRGSKKKSVQCTHHVSSWSDYSSMHVRLDMA